VSDSTNSGKCSKCRHGAIKEDLRVSFSLPPLSNHGLLSSGGGGKDWGASVGQGKASISQGVSSIASIGQRVGGVGDRECGGVVDERSGSRDDSGGSTQDGGISRSLAVVTERRNAVISNSHGDGVSSDFVGNLGGSVNN